MIKFLNHLGPHRGMRLRADGFFTQIVLPAPLTSPEGKELRKYILANVHMTVFPKKKYFNDVLFIYCFFCLPPWSKFSLGESVKHVIH